MVEAAMGEAGKGESEAATTAGSLMRIDRPTDSECKSNPDERILLLEPDLTSPSLSSSSLSSSLMIFDLRRFWSNKGGGYPPRSLVVVVIDGE